MKRYTIKKGNHYSCPPHLRLHFGKTSGIIRFKFSADCLFPVVEPDDFDQNKLAGWSFGLHHKNSVRVTWRPDTETKNKLALFSYCYNNGKRKMEYITSIDIEQLYSVSITIASDRVQFMLHDSNGNFLAQTTADFILPKFKWGYFLGFYFGGNKVAPKTMSAEFSIR